MGFLQNKRILITGVISNRSIAYGIAKACHEQGAELAFTYADERFKERVTEFAASFGSQIVIPCDVASDEAIDSCIKTLSEHWDSMDGLVHSIGFAPREAIAGTFFDGLSRENFRIAHDISAYSFAALTKAALPLLEPRQGSAITLSYLGAEKVIPHYNTMGLAKASLEASVRYVAATIGPKGMRANAISAGPIKTLAASGIKDFSAIFNYVEKNAPLRRNVTIEQVGNTAAFLLSDLSSGITGQTIYVDSGFVSVVPGMDPNQE